MFSDYTWAPAGGRGENRNKWCVSVVFIHHGLGPGPSDPQRAAGKPSQLRFAAAFCATFTLEPVESHDDEH